jgi:hypothetical protein
VVAYKTSGEAYGQYTADKSTHIYNTQMEILLTSFTKRPTTSFSKQDLVAGCAAAVAVAGGVVLGIRLRFHNHAPQQLASGLAFHQQAADELGGNLLGGAGEERLGEVLGGVGGYGSGLGDETQVCLTENNALLPIK